MPIATRSGGPAELYLGHAIHSPTHMLTVLLEMKPQAKAKVENLMRIGIETVT